MCTHEERYLATYRPMELPAYIVVCVRTVAFVCVPLYICVCVCMSFYICIHTCNAHLPIHVQVLGGPFDLVSLLSIS